MFLLNLPEIIANFNKKNFKNQPKIVPKSDGSFNSCECQTETKITLFH